MNNQIVKFQGNELAYTTVDGVHYVAIKPICEAIGFRHDTALEGIKSHPILAQLYGLHRIVAGDGKAREMATLPLSHLNGWLFTIDANRVGEQARASLLAYQERCFAVLHEHFFGRQEAHEQAKSLHHQILVIKAELKLAQNAHKNSETAYRVGELKTELQALEAQQSVLNIERYGKPVQLELLSSPTV